MNSLIDDVPIRSRAGVDLMSLDSVVLNPDGLAGTCQRASPGSAGLGVPRPRDAGHGLEGQVVTVQPARLSHHRVGPELEAGRETNVALPPGSSTTTPTVLDPITLLPLKIRSAVAPGVAITTKDGRRVFA